MANQSHDPATAKRATTSKKKPTTDDTTAKPDVEAVEESVVTVETPDVETKADDGFKGIEIKDGKAIPDTDEVVRFTKKNRRRPIVGISNRPVQKPIGRIIQEGEPIRFEAESDGFYVIVKENTYQERYVFGSSRPSYFLLYRAGQKIPKSRLQNLG